MDNGSNNGYYRLKEIVITNNRANLKQMAYINYLDLKNIKTMNFQYLTTFPSRAKWILDKNTIIIGRVGDINNLKCNNSIIRENISNLVGSSGFTCFKSKANYIFNEYLWYCIGTSPLFATEI